MGAAHQSENKVVDSSGRGRVTSNSRKRVLWAAGEGTGKVELGTSKPKNMLVCEARGDTAKPKKDRLGQPVWRRHSEVKKNAIGRYRGWEG